MCLGANFFANKPDKTVQNTKIGYESPKCRALSCFHWYLSKCKWGSYFLVNRSNQMHVNKAPETPRLVSDFLVSQETQGHGETQSHGWLEFWNTGLISVYSCENRRDGRSTIQLKFLEPLEGCLKRGVKSGCESFENPIWLQLGILWSEFGPERALLCLMQSFF